MYVTEDITSKSVLPHAPAGHTVHRQVPKVFFLLINVCSKLIIACLIRDGKIRAGHLFLWL